MKILICLTILAIISCETTVAKAGQIKLDPIKVHVVPHTHDDAGWLWTYNDYFHGSASFVLGVKDILTSMVANLEKDPKRTFIEVEIAFFEKWWIEQTETTKNKVKKFVTEGRLEFINGGYVMHDEATTYFQHLIDQTRLGLLFLKREFNFIPKTGWFIDPFGHSAANAAILQQMGYEQIVFVRIDDKEKQIRRANGSLEFKWKPLQQITTYKDTEIFTHITYEHYCVPHGMEDMDNDDNHLDWSDAEWKRRADDLYNKMREYTGGYLTQNLMLMYGCDFTHRAKENSFANLEKMMKVVNQYHPDIQLVYSTPSKYFSDVKSTQKPWTEYNNQDFFPYADNDYAYWSGYFTSRPYLKGMVREAGNYLANSSKFLMEYLLSSRVKGKNIEGNFYHAMMNDIFMRRNLAICQHHDAVAGTAKELVSQDYIRLLNDSITKIRNTMRMVFRDLMKLKNDRKIQVCVDPVSNFACEKMYSEMNADGFQKYLIFNNSNSKGPQPITLRLTDSNYIILGSDMNEIQSDIICEFGVHDTKLCQAYFNFDFKEKYESSFFIKQVKENREIKKEKLITTANTLYDDNLIKIESIFDDHPSSLKVTIKENKEKNVVQQSYQVRLKHAFYHSYNGGDSDIRPTGSNSDGAYIFSPEEEQPNIGSIHFADSYTKKGKNLIQLSLRNDMSVMHLRYNPIMKYVIEVESVWDHMYLGDEGRNLLLHMRADIKNDVKVGNDVHSQFWTDANGMKMMKRHKDYREGWAYRVTERVGANFYPINSAVAIRDVPSEIHSMSDYQGMTNDDRMITIHNDRAQSAGAMESGSVMIIQNRFSHNDDGRGVGEPIYEQNSLPYDWRIKNWVTFSNYYDRFALSKHIHDRPTIVSIDSKETKSVGSLGFSKSLLNDMVSATECMDVNYHILDSKTVLVQAFNKDDPFNNRNDDKCTIRFGGFTTYRYTLSEMKLSGTYKLKSDLEKLINSSKNIQALRKLNGTDVLQYQLGFQEFKLFEIKFN